MRRLLALLLRLPALVPLGTDASATTSAANANDLTPVEVTMVGPSAVRIRIAQGTTFPCDSGDNRMLVQGKFEPGQVVHLTTPDRCVCLQQTYAPFSDVDWGASGMACRPMICTFRGRVRHCVPAADPTIRVIIRSARPS